LALPLRTKILTYVVLLHGILAAAALVVLMERPALLLLFEALFLLSAAVGYLLLRAFFVPLELIRTGAELMRERDFTTRFRKVGQPEMDQLTEIYNEMVERLRSERLLLEEQNVFVGKLLHASPTAITVLDHDGRIADVNPAAERLFDRPAARLVGRPPAELPAPFGAALGSLADGEARIVALEDRRLNCRRSEFFDRGAQRAYFMVDELTEELRSSERAAYGKLIRMMSHEVQNSVTSVRSLLESCGHYTHQLHDDDRQDMEQALEVSSGRLDHLSQFMRSLASVVRVPEPERCPTDVVALLRDLESLLRPELEEKRIAVEWRLGESRTVVALDKNQIEQVLVNVMRNAVEAIGTGGTIRIVTEREAGTVWLSVQDSGCGIPADSATQLFTPFFSTKRDGQGVGLTLTREILSRHGFRFRLQNRPEGGAEFRIRFDP
jgi:nitrogen fixation/metabolism regulation signal transduction histidine kinase